MGILGNWISAAIVTTVLAACSSTVEPAESGGQGGAGPTGPGPNGSGPTASGSGAVGAGGGQDFGACDAMSTCTLAVPGCCGTCGMVTLTAVEPINAQLQDAFFAATCPDPDQTPCPGCASFPNGNLYAYCESGRCQEGDVSQGTFSECAQSADCTLRWGSGCCEACDGTWEPGFGGTLIAIATSKLGAFAILVCGEGDIGCPACAPQYPPGAFADCVAGHCAVIQADPGGG